MKKNSLLRLSALLALISIGCLNCLAQHDEPNNAEFFGKQELVINDFPAKGFILDIGGGGAGVIGQLKGDQVISIDLLKQELIDAPSTNMKIVMDGRDLKFLDNSFNTVAIFYAMMYIHEDEDQAKVIKEVKRVLKHGGKLLIWDVNLPTSKERSKDEGIYQFKFILPNTVINTGYGVGYPKKNPHNLQYYINLAKNQGFKVVKSNVNEPSFYLELQTNPSVTDTLSQIIEKNGVDVAVKSFEELKKNKAKDYYFGADVMFELANTLYTSGKSKESLEIFKLASKNYTLDESQVNTFGYQLLGKNLITEAIEVFKTNVEKYPNSSNVYDSLGEAYMNAGNKELAIENYEKSVKLNPKNTNGIEALKKLKVK